VQENQEKDFIKLYPFL